MTILTIVIPTKNEGVNLKILCESLSRQSFKELFEVIIVDDSDPHYEKLVTSCISVLEDAGVKVRYLKGCGKGVGAAMLKGLEASNGRYVLFLDADNVLEENFMLEVMPLLVRGMFVSFLSRSIISKGFTGLFYANQLLATLKGRLRFHKKYGFVNTLYIWRKDVIMKMAKLSNFKLSLLDQLNLNDLIKKNVAESKGYTHIDKVLVEDIRHIFNNFDHVFIYNRLKWYWGSVGGIREVLRLKDFKMAILILPLAVFLVLLSYMLLSAANPAIPMVIAILYVFALTSTFKVKSCNPFIQLLLAILWLPLLTLVKSVIVYVFLYTMIKGG